MIRCAHAWSAPLKRCCGSRESAAKATEATTSANSATTSGPKRRAMWLQSASAGSDFLPRKGHIAEVRPEPALGLLERHALAGGVVLHLVAGEPADGEVARERVREVDPADSGSRRHRERVRQRDAGRLLGPEQVEELSLLGVVRTRRITEGRTDPAELLRSQLVGRELLVGLVPRAPHNLVEVLRERLGEAVGEGLDHDRAVIVVLRLVVSGELVGAVDRDRERADVVAVGADVVGEAAVRARVAVRGLLAQEREARS